MAPEFEPESRSELDLMLDPECELEIEFEIEPIIVREPMTGPHP